MENPIKNMTLNAPIKEMGMVMAGIKVALQFLRNKKIIKTTNPIEINKLIQTSSIASLTNSE